HSSVGRTSRRLARSSHAGSLRGGRRGRAGAAVGLVPGRGGGPALGGVGPRPGGVGPRPGGVGPRGGAPPGGRGGGGAPPGGRGGVGGCGGVRMAVLSLGDGTRYNTTSDSSHADRRPRAFLSRPHAPRRLARAQRQPAPRW